MGICTFLTKFGNTLKFVKKFNFVSSLIMLCLLLLKIGNKLPKFLILLSKKLKRNSASSFLFDILNDKPI